MKIAVLALAAVLGAFAVPAAAADRPVVVELFTSQGCDSCPPADAFLGELARRPGVLALALHVDYWDYIGWKDRFADPAFTERQRSYSRALGQRYVYTPQMVIDGRAQEVGSKRGAVDKLIDKARKQAAFGPTLALGTGGKSIEIGPVPAFKGPGAVWLVAWEGERKTDVLRGENRGKTLANFNVVRAWHRLGAYDGRAGSLPLDFSAVPKSCDGAAVIVQEDDTGPIVAAQILALPNR